jgi:hypothetical protein
MNSNENRRKEVRSIFDCVSPGKGAILAAVIADILADGLDSVQITVLATFITAVGESLGYIAAQTELNEQLIGGAEDANSVLLAVR